MSKMINNLCDVYNFFEKNLYFNKTFYNTNRIYYTMSNRDKTLL